MKYAYVYADEKVNAMKTYFYFEAKEWISWCRWGCNDYACMCHGGVTASSKKCCETLAMDPEMHLWCLQPLSFPIVHIPISHMSLILSWFVVKVKSRQTLQQIQATFRCCAVALYHNLPKTNWRHEQNLQFTTKQPQNKRRHLTGEVLFELGSKNVLHLVFTKH